MYRDLRALGVSVCFTRFMKKIERESLLISALVLALKFRCSSKCIPGGLKRQYCLFCENERLKLCQPN